MTMEILPDPKNIDDSALDFLKVLMGEDGVAFLDLDNAITAVKQGQPFWQAPFAVGLYALPFLYRRETVSQGTAVQVWELLVLELASQIHVKNKDMIASDLVGSALEPLEARYNSLSTEIPGYGLGNEQSHILFHIRFALGILLLLKGDERRARGILREMAATKTAKRGPTWSSEGLKQLDVEETKGLAAVILQDFYARRQDYEMALDLLTEAVASNSPGPFSYSEPLLAVAPGLIESFTQRCERVNSFYEWVGLFDRAADITEICGEADVSGELPSECNVASPQFMAWKFGQLVARFAIQNGLYPGDGKKLLPCGYQDRRTVMDAILQEGGYSSDWGNGTAVASLLCEYDEHRNWQILRQQYVSMWEDSSRYQWLSLREVGTQTDLYWAMRIGFADQMLTTKEQIPIITQPSTVVSDIETTKDIASTVALRQLKEQSDIHNVLELLQKLNERQPPSKQEVRQHLQQRLGPVWGKLPTKVVDTLVKAENYYRTGVNSDDAKVWFNKAVEASLSCCLVEPLISFMQKRGDKRIAICFPPPRGVERRTSSELRKLSLWEWSDVFETLNVPVGKSLASLGAEDLKQFMKEYFRELPLPALRELSHSLRDFCQRKDSAHFHVPRYEEEIQELEQMRELVLDMKRPSVITQIFQLFGAGK